MSWRERRGGMERAMAIAAVFRMPAFFGQCVLPSLGTPSHTDTANLNNEGVSAMTKGDFELAISKLEAARKADPHYELAVRNLAIAHNNYGLRLQKLPALALKHFHQAVFLEPTNGTSLSNMEQVIRLMGKRADSFTDRVRLGDDALAENDPVGASVEYQAALNIHDDPGVRQKLEVVKAQIAKGASSLEEVPAYELAVATKINELWSKTDHSKAGLDLKLSLTTEGSIYKVEVSKSSRDPVLDKQASELAQTCSPLPRPPKGVTEVFVHVGPVADFGPYMMELQGCIKRAWHPPKRQESTPVTAQFCIDRGGYVSHVAIGHSSGVAGADKAALKAIRDAAPFKPLPEGSPVVVDVQFTFDKNILARDSGASIIQKQAQDATREEGGGSGRK